MAVLGVRMNAAEVKTAAQSALITTAQVGGLAGVLFTGFTVVVGVRIFRSRHGRGG